MSNSQVGQVYQQIIQDVIEASRTDFEEGGIDENVLDELKKVSLASLCLQCFLLPSNLA
jgi:transcription initiation factor TFIIA large subunit